MLNFGAIVGALKQSIATAVVGKEDAVHHNRRTFGHPRLR